MLQSKTSNCMIPDDMLPPSESDSDEEENLGDKVVNANRRTVTRVDSEESSEEEET